MGERCGVKIEIGDVSQSIKFWRFMKDRTGGVPGQRDEWRGLVVRTSPLNSAHDAITIRIGSDLLRLCIETSGSSRSQDTSERMREYSWKIQDFMSDQELDGNPQEDSKEGKSIAVQRHWTFDDEDEWADAVFWIKEQQERLAAILVQG